MRTTRGICLPPVAREPGQKAGPGRSGLKEPGQVKTGMLLLPCTSSLNSVPVTNTGRGDKGISELLLFPRVFIIPC